MTVQLDITDRPVFLLGYSLDRIIYPDGVASPGAVGTVQVNATVVASGVASSVAVGSAATATQMLPVGVAGSGGVGTPALTLAGSDMFPTGIASTAAVGSTQVDATVAVSGVASSAAVGVPSAAKVMSPTGIASSSAVGSPSAVLVMSPVGVASGLQLGATSIDTTVLVYPQPVTSQESFGPVTVTRKGWLFRPPVNTYQWRLFKEYEGISLLKENGVWSEVAHPDLERTRTAEVYLGGGRDHFVDDVIRAELIAEGYTVTEEIIP